MGYDDVITEVGNFGLYRLRILLVLFLPIVACACLSMGGIFFTATADFRCLSPYESPENATYQLSPNITDPTYLWNEETKTWPQCERYDPDFVKELHTTGENLTSIITTVKCDSFVYDRTYYTQTVTTEWNLVCDDAWLKTLSESLFMMGNIPGSVICGLMSDKYGRKTTLLWGSIVQLILAVLVTVSPNFQAYTVLRLLLGATTMGLYLVGYVAAVEMVSPQHRSTVGVFGSIFFGVGYILSAGLAYYIKIWRYLQIALTIPTILLLAFWWSVPESARWLLNKGRVQEAKDIIQKVFSESGVELSPDKLDGLLPDDKNSTTAVEKTSVFDLLRYPNLRKRSLLLFSIWFAVSVTYYGLSWNTFNLGGDDYINFGIAAVVEVAACFVVILTLDRCGRKKTSSGGMLLGGILLLLTFFVPSGMTWLTILLTMLGKLAVTSSCVTLFVYTAELYPTSDRNVGDAACAAFANIGATVAPQISYLFEISTHLPLFILGSCTFIAGLLAMQLPETVNTILPETIEDVEKLGKNRSNNRWKSRTP